MGGSHLAPLDPLPKPLPEPSSTKENLLVAFLGDQGANQDSDAVLTLIRNEGADAVVHNGDFDYQDQPDVWDDRITRILGADFPYFAVIGNHDAAAWDGPSGYGSKVLARLNRVPSMNCTGQPGVMASCDFFGLHLVMSCIGTQEYTGAPCERLGRAARLPREDAEGLSVSFPDLLVAQEPTGDAGGRKGR